MLKRSFIAIVASLGLVAAPAVAQSPSESAHGVIEKVEARNPSLKTFQTRLHVDVRMLNFPFLAPKLDGSAYFKRPSNYEVVFDRVPSYAKGFKRLFADVGDAASWERENNVSLVGSNSLNGRPMLVLRLTKKVYSDQVDHADIYVDASSYQVAQMEWYYRNGGKIVMTQNYKTEGPFNVIATQHAEIAIPHVHAVADATYGQYETNVAVSDEVFSNK
ncbi:MAG: hypothetical protein JO165_01630 [Candidatus Eremiobacteraeota bacterium]|nr:hypothetical protein [Candidatus Eremiobacteraeota bacterium]